jgi:hypothetical protein
LNQGFKLAKQALYLFSHTSSPFGYEYFFQDGGLGLTNYLPGLALNLNPSNLSLSSSWLRVWATVPNFFSPFFFL